MLYKSEAAIKDKEEFQYTNTDRLLLPNLNFYVVWPENIPDCLKVISDFWRFVERKFIEILF